MTDVKDTRSQGEKPLPIGGTKAGAKAGFVFNGVRLVGRQALALLGLFLVILSIPIGFITPAIPIGLPIGLFGSALLARNSVWGQRLIRGLVNRFPRLEKIIPDWLENLVFGKQKAD